MSWPGFIAFAIAAMAWYLTSGIVSDVIFGMLFASVLFGRYLPAAMKRRVSDTAGVRHGLSSADGPALASSETKSTKQLARSIGLGG